jgi:putative redox protein|tara:strand:- start:658 stop:1083 length:426 start_codon:yes stop_codon:yes gene_type:complete
MKAKITWDGKVKFIAESESGHRVLMDGPPDYGGENAGPRPMEMMLMGMGGCSAFDVVHILQKSHQNVATCVAEITAVRAKETPAVFTKIHLHFLVSGDNLKESTVRNAVKLSAEKYCSASVMLTRGGVEVTHTFEIDGSKI